MADPTHKLTPAEFLAELQRHGAARSQKRAAAESELSGHPDNGDLSNGKHSDNGAGGHAAHSSQHSALATADDADHEPGASHTPAKSNGSSGSAASDPVPEVVAGHANLSSLFERVNLLLGSTEQDDGSGFAPRCPDTLEEARLSTEDVERLIMKYLLQKGSGTGRHMCAHICLPYKLVDPVLKQLKQEQLVAFKGAATMGDYNYMITDHGRERARRYNAECTYFGAAPVAMPDYLRAMGEQSIAKQKVTEDDLSRAFSDLIISKSMLTRLGPAINSGRGMFLFGEPGNGKTSIAERVTACFGSTIWIPKAIAVDGDIIRLFDPGVHEAVEQQAHEGLFDLSGLDQRWVQVVRPTIIAGGELTMDELEIVQNEQTKICEAPLQLKSNCGALVIDDFGRQRMPVDVLLNRWIVPLEKRYDYLNLPSGKKIQVPFDQLIIFSTNLEPKDLVDGAFLRRIPYKIEVPDPTLEEFGAIFKLMAPLNGFEYDQDAFDYLIENHYRPINRPFRACQPRDLLQQVKNYCTFKITPRKMTPEAFDFAVENYFSVM